MYAARDKDNNIQFFSTKPYYWIADSALSRIGFVADKENHKILPELTSENSPQEVNLVII